MMLSDPSHLRRECQAFARYLIGDAPLPYVIEKYVSAHDKRPALVPAHAFDRFLVGFAAAGPFFTKIADSYARLVAPASPLRKKLILLLAILESSSPAYRSFERVDAGAAPLLILKILLAQSGFALSFALGALVLFPAQAALLLMGGASKEKS
jgi:hypothetical protein